MRATVACLVIAYFVLLALPDTFGAPAADCGCPKSEQVLSEKVEKESSKSSEKLAQEEKQASEVKSRCSNGFVSGSKSTSQSRDLKESEEEQSRMASEKKTATGTEKVEESVKKKKVVTVSEKKSVLVYYMVSYKKLPAQGKSECKKDYYTRIFPKEDNMHVFYRKVFKVYEGEEPAAYIQRIEDIMDHVYPELDCRLDVNWLEQFDHYYTLKYSRKVDEPDDEYYRRVLQKLYGESCEHYKKRMASLVAALDEEDFSHITFDDSEVGYKVGQRKTPAKTVSKPASSAQATSKVSTSTKKSEEQKEEVAKSQSAEQQKTAKGSSCSTNKAVKKKKKTAVAKQESKECTAYRVAYNRLPKINPGEDFATYYTEVFGEYHDGMSLQERNELYLRILIQYKGERCRDYVRRIDYLFDYIYPKLDIRANKSLISLLDHYYRVKYQKRRVETNQHWYARILTKGKGECAQHYKDRVDCLKAVFNTVNWSEISIDENSSIGYKLVSGLSQLTSAIGRVSRRLF